MAIPTVFGTEIEYNATVSDSDTMNRDRQIETVRAETAVPKCRSVARLSRPTSCLRVGLFALFYVAGCGYKPVTAHLPEGVNSLVIPVAENRTAFEDLSAPLTATLRRTAARAGLSVVSKGARAAVLRIAVVSVRGEAGMLQKEGDHLRALDRIWNVEAEAFLEGPDGAVLIPKQRFTVAGRALSLSSPTSEEALGAERRAALLDDLAAAIVREFFE